MIFTGTARITTDGIHSITGITPGIPGDGITIIGEAGITGIAGIPGAIRFTVSPEPTL